MKQAFDLLSQPYVPLEDVLNFVFAREKDRTPWDYEVGIKPRVRAKTKLTEEQLVKRAQKHGNDIF